MYRILIPLILLFGLLLSTEMQPQDMVEVPDVLGLEVGDAWRKIKKTGLHMVAVPELTTEDRPGTVLKQTPEPYTRVLDTNTVYLIIAAIIDTVIQSHQLVVVPKVEGLDLLDARRTILEFGLHMVAVPEINVEYPLGTVLKQTPEPGKQVLDTTTVYLNIAAINDLVKQFQDTVRVPNVKGLDLREARRTIFDNGLYMVAVPEITIEYLLGTVFEQDPEPGSQVSLNTTVYLKVATISEMVDVPDVVGQLLENARDSLQSIRLLLSTYQAVTTEHPPGTVIEQSPVLGSKVRTGTTIFLKIAQEDTSLVSLINGSGQVDDDSPLLLYILPGVIGILAAGLILRRIRKKKSRNEKLAKTFPDIRIKSRIHFGIQKIPQKKVVDKDWQLQLKHILDDGKQNILVNDSLILKEQKGVGSIENTIVPTASQIDSADKADIQELSSQITKAWQSSKIKSLAQLAFNFNINIELKPIWDNGKQNIQVEESLREKMNIDITMLEEPKKME